MKMAWIFSLSAECGSDESNANKFAEHFEGISFLLSNGHQCQCRTDTFQDIRSVGKQKQGIEATSHLFLYFNP